MKLPILNRLLGAKEFTMGSAAIYRHAIEQRLDMDSRGVTPMPPARNTTGRFPRFFGSIVNSPRGGPIAMESPGFTRSCKWLEIKPSGALAFGAGSSFTLIRKCLPSCRYFFRPYRDEGDGRASYPVLKDWAIVCRPYRD